MAEAVAKKQSGDKFVSVLLSGANDWLLPADDHQAHRWDREVIGLLFAHHTPTDISSRGVVLRWPRSSLCAVSAVRIRCFAHCRSLSTLHRVSSRSSVSQSRGLNQAHQFCPSWPTHMRQLWRHHRPRPRLPGRGRETRCPTQQPQLASQPGIVLSQAVMVEVVQPYVSWRHNLPTESNQL